MAFILPVLLLPEPGEGKPAAALPLLGKPSYLHALASLEAVAGTCVALPEGGAPEEAKALFPCDRRFVASLQEAATILDKGLMLVVRGDMPCLQADTLRFLLSAVEDGAKAAFLQWQGEDLEQEPGLRMGGTAYCFDLAALITVLGSLEEEGAGCTPLDALTAMNERGMALRGVAAGGEELISVRTRLDFANAFAVLQEQVNAYHMTNGVMLLDPGAAYIDTDVVIGPDTVVYPGCHLQKGSQIGAGCTLLPNCRLSGAVLAEGVTVESSVLIGCRVGAGTTVGPFAYLRPDSVVGEKCRIGDFVEIKNSHVGNGTKISHLTYVGDGDLGGNINLGCGVVFTNYDGKRKHRTAVGDNAFIGCNVNLVAPVNVGKDAYVAAGSTVTEDVPEGALYIARTRGTVKEGWVKKRREEGKL